MMRRWVIGGATAILALLVAACIVAVLKIDISPETQRVKRPVRKQNLGEGIRISQHGLFGVDLVSIGRVHMRKLRKGPFTIGAINELVLEDVSLALPDELWNAGTGSPAKAKGEGGKRTVEGGPKAMLEKLGIKAGQLKMGGRVPRFSALAIRNLRVARIVDGTNAVPWFAAAHGEAERGGLKMKSGYTVEGGKTNGWKEALLVVEPELKLWSR